MFDDEVVDTGFVEATPDVIVQPETQEQEATVDNVETVEQINPTAVGQKKKVSPEESFKAIRERAAKAERERAELARRLEEIERQKSATPDEDLEFNLGADELAEGKHLSKVDKKIKKLKDELANLREAAHQTALEKELLKVHKDFDEVVSDENIKKLEELNPRKFRVIKNSNADLYDKGLEAYEAIMALGIHENDEFREERQVAEKNLAKPRPLISGASQRGDTPLSNANAFANGLTKDLQKKLWQEMQDLRRKS